MIILMIESGGMLFSAMLVKKKAAKGYSFSNL